MTCRKRWASVRSLDHEVTGGQGSRRRLLSSVWVRMNVFALVEHSV